MAPERTVSATPFVKRIARAGATAASLLLAAIAVSAQGAEITTGEPWAADPGCYLSDEEIAGQPVGTPAGSAAADRL